MTIEYDDPYLLKHMSYEVEQRATSDVALLGTFTDAWTAELVKLQAYINVCRANTTNPEDTYYHKLKDYEAKFRGQLARAENASPDDDGNYQPIFSVPIERA